MAGIADQLFKSMESYSIARFKRARSTTERTRLFYRNSCVFLLLAWLAGCASTDELFVQYDVNFCPVPAPAVAVRDIALVEGLEVPFLARKLLSWEPAVYFNDDSSALSAAAQQSLQNNINVLKSFPQYLVTVRGFTDERAPLDYNQELGIDRVLSVRTFLGKNGIGSDRVIGESLGESISLAEDSPVASPINRRVELMLLDRDGRPFSSQRQLIMRSTE
ncbi:hypothetical protein AB833_07240 [Chromatiales bacterium (ex Bugula neritina AB1)]|nr:hypothetical protein AB833_07240 [Chromatiales bacterium (ex Bugula neritina AB1)]